MPGSQLLKSESPARETRRRIKAVILGSLGNFVEWYDFYAYTAFALYF
ncbi:MAG TPA: alpha-ketoglutarate permease, partial [Methylovirgula sp.]